MSQSEPPPDPRARRPVREGFRVTDHAPSSYGASQETAAACLNQLLLQQKTTARSTPHEPAQVAQLLACRAAAIDALRDRLTHLGIDRRHGAATNETALRLCATPLQPAHVLDQVAHRLATPRPGRNVLSPVEALGQPSDDAGVELWRRAAVELTGATHALTTAAQQHWRHEAAGAWHLLGDLATTLEAVAVLDTSLVAAGLVDEQAAGPATVKATAKAGPRSRWSLAEQRMVTSQVARAAGWYATTTDPDLATPASRRPDRGPLQIVATTRDLASAQRRLGSYVQAVDLNDPFASTLRSMDARTARAIARSQHQMCDWASRHSTPRADGGPDPAAAFTALREVYSDLLPHLERLVDINDRGVNRPALAQQQQINASLTRHQATLDLSRAEVLDLAEATHDVLRHLATSTRREAMRDASTLRQRDPIGATPPHRLARRTPPYQALTMAMQTPPPRTTLPHWTPMTSRRDLAATLDRTPTGRRPSPYPGGPRGLGPPQRTGPER